MPDYQELLDACHKPFKWWEHEFNPQGHIYVKIQNTHLRLNSLGVPWHWNVDNVTVVDNHELTRSGKKQYDAVVWGHLTIEGLGTRGAPAANTNFDKDNAVKGADSYATRKAGSKFGISHYLMVNPQAESNFVKFMETANLADLPTAKKAVKLVADIAGVDPKTWLLAHGTDEFNNPAHLAMALEQAGRI